MWASAPWFQFPTVIALSCRSASIGFAVCFAWWSPPGTASHKKKGFVKHNVPKFKSKCGAWADCMHDELDDMPMDMPGLTSLNIDATMGALRTANADVADVLGFVLHWCRRLEHEDGDDEDFAHTLFQVVQHADLKTNSGKCKIITLRCLLTPLDK